MIETKHSCSFRAAIPFALALALTGLCRAESPAQTSSGLIYHPEDDAIAIRNGTRWDNRPLYCHERFSFYWTGEMPGLRGESGILRFGFERDGKRRMLDQFSERVMRYRPGWIEWECRDEALPGLTVSVAATTLAEGNGVTARIASKGARPGDKTLWVAFTPDADKGASYRVKPAAGGYSLEPEPARELANLVARFGPTAPVFGALAYSDHASPEKASAALPDVLGGAGVVASVPLSDAAPQSMAMISPGEVSSRQRVMPSSESP